MPEALCPSSDSWAGCRFFHIHLMWRRIILWGGNVNCCRTKLNHCLTHNLSLSLSLFPAVCCCECWRWPWTLPPHPTPPYLIPLLEWRYGVAHGFLIIWNLSKMLLNWIKVLCNNCSPVWINLVFSFHWISSALDSSSGFELKVLPLWMLVCHSCCLWHALGLKNNSCPCTVNTWHICILSLWCVTHTEVCLAVLTTCWWSWAVVWTTDSAPLTCC